MLLGVLSAIFAFEKETTTKPLGMTLTRFQFDCLLADLSSKAGFEFGEEPYSGITLHGVRIGWIDDKS